MGCSFKRRGRCRRCYTSPPGNEPSPALPGLRAAFPPRPRLAAAVTPLGAAHGGGVAARTLGAAAGGANSCPAGIKWDMSPAPADGTGLEPGLETEPGELASEQGLRRGARGCERLGVKDSWRRRCPLLILYPSALISQAHGLWDIERAGNLLFRCLLLENSSNLLKLKLLMGMLVWETESPGPVSWSISHLSPLAGTSMGRSVPILTRNRKVLDLQTAQNKWVFQPALPTPPASTAPAVRASSAQPGRWYSSNWKAGL